MRLIVAFQWCTVGASLPARVPSSHSAARCLPTAPAWLGVLMCITFLGSIHTRSGPLSLSPVPLLRCAALCRAVLCCAGMPMLPPMMDADGVPIATPFPMMPFHGESLKLL